MSRTPQAAPARPRGCLASVLLLCLAVPLLAALAYGVDALAAAPWAYPVFGRPTLTGTWLGEFTVPSGTRFALFLDLKHELWSQGEPEAEGEISGLIDGQGSWCADHGRRAENIPLDGYVPLLSGYNGTVGRLEIDLQSARNPQLGLQPAYFKGSWNANTLALVPILIRSDGHGLISSTTDPDLTPPMMIVLKKANEAAYRASCASFGGAPT